MPSSSLAYRLPARLIAVGALLCALLFTSACTRTETQQTRQVGQTKQGESGAAQAAEAPPVVVTMARATVREVPATIEATGSLAANETSNVAPQTSGQVAYTPVSAGAFVHQGDVIARLNEKDARLRLQQAQAGAQQAAAAVRQAEVRLGLGPNGRFDASAIPEVRSAAAAYQAALAQEQLAEANARRYANLVETGDVARSVYDQYRTQADTARAQANNARQQMETTVNVARQNNQAIQTAQATLEGARAQVAIAQKAVSDTTIRAPYPGYISARPIAVGEYVTTASVIATILLTNPLKLQLQVPEGDAPKVHVGMSVSLSVDAYPDRKFAGRVSAINPAIDPTSRSVTVEAEVDNPDNALRAGMFATARITLPGGNQVVFVPREAVVNDQNTNSYRVFVIQNGTAHLRVLQIGDEENGWVQILSGVQGDEMVATSNLQQLYEGARVQVTQQPQPQQQQQPNKQ
ncbi:MAG TPA: efflux RND transporter periplasmic adaptor subunit [Pyrinomonadaceae bacterium]|nr:efflux RND transporter periplasmic adaptor subunit [Pyrinomonadaceae bacterium]